MRKNYSNKPLKDLRRQISALLYYFFVKTGHQQSYHNLSDIGGWVINAKFKTLNQVERVYIINIWFKIICTFSGTFFL